MTGRRDALALVRREPLGAGTRLRLAAEVLVTYVQVRRLLARHDITHVVEALRGGAQDALDPPAARRAAHRLAHVTRRTLRFLRLDARCLPVALVLLRMMARRGARGTLLIGTRSEPSFEAHAWVEHAGRPVLPTHGYASLTAL